MPIFAITADLKADQDPIVQNAVVEEKKNATRKRNTNQVAVVVTTEEIVPVQDHDHMNVADGMTVTNHIKIAHIAIAPVMLKQLN